MWVCTKVKSFCQRIWISYISRRVCWDIRAIKTLCRWKFRLFHKKMVFISELLCRLFPPTWSVLSHFHFASKRNLLIWSLFNSNPLWDSINRHGFSFAFTFTTFTPTPCLMILLITLWTCSVLLILNGQELFLISLNRLSLLRFV